MTRIILVFAIAVMTPTSIAETLTFHPFRIEVESGWVHEVESGAATPTGFGPKISIYSPDSRSALTIRTMDAPAEVSAEALRNMTNVDPSISLVWRDWGDYAGYQYDYSEGNTFYRTWWLARGAEMIFVTYDSAADPNNIEMELVDRMVDSLGHLDQP